MAEWVLVVFFGLFCAFLAHFIWQQFQHIARCHQKLSQIDNLLQHTLTQKDTTHQIMTNLFQSQQEHYQRFDQHQMKSLTLIQESLQQSLQSVQDQVNGSLRHQTDTLVHHVLGLTQDTQMQLKDISGKVDQRLALGFEKTTSTFLDVMNRLTLIDEAQKKITELSTNVISLQDILTDKRSRGTFGEIQLAQLVHNMLAPTQYALQYTLSNGKRCDCILHLPPPTGSIVIDAKFTLENYQKMCNNTLTKEMRRSAEQQFKLDLRKHIRDISEKYIIPNETADGAMLFVPAEAIFAEIHAHHLDIVEAAQRLQVWLVSPTTLMAVLNTTRAVLKDAATRKQIHIIQEHLAELNKDFERFQKRMDNLNKHINLAHQDIIEVHQSSKKITNRFYKIESAELKNENQA